MVPTSAKMTSKGQITLPASLRKELGLKPGDRVDFARNADGKVEMTARTYSMSDLRGFIKTSVILSDEELNSALSDSWGTRWRSPDGIEGQDP